MRFRVRVIVTLLRARRMRSSARFSSFLRRVRVRVRVGARVRVRVRVRRVACA